MKPFAIAALLACLLISASLAGAQTLQTFYAFASTNGCNPQTPLTVGLDGNFYGTTITGHTNNGDGTIFKVTTNGVLTLLLQFSGTNGSIPAASLTLATDGCLYGTTEYGGSYGDGTIFKITTDDTFTLLDSFNSTNGANPTASLTLGPDGSLYGTTVYGGSGYGVVFNVTTNGVLTKLASFTSAYQLAYNIQNKSALIFGTDGALYGTTAYGGPSGDGQVFRVTTNGILSIFVSQLSFGADGNAYAPGLTLGKDGNFYGILCFGGPEGYGSIYKITSIGTLSTIYTFPWTSSGYYYPNGGNPLGNLIAGNDGYLYGTAKYGGTNGPNTGYGTIFIISPSSGVLTPLASLAITNGTNPYAGLTIGGDGNLYGRTSYGGIGGNGTIFRVLLPPSIVVPTHNLTHIAGSTASFTVNAASFQPLTYQWQKNGINLIAAGNLSGIQTSNLVVTGLSDSDAGIYSVIVSNANFGVTNVATLTVIDPPVITLQPMDQRVLAGQPVSFSITVSNPPPVSYQWNFNAVGIPQSTNAVLTIPAAALTNDGVYSVVVTNLAGSVTSSNATLTVIVPPTMGLQLSAGYPVLSLGGMLSHNFLVQYTSDLAGTNWITLLSLSNLLVSPYVFLDPAGISPPARFYRAVMQ